MKYLQFLAAVAAVSAFEVSAKAPKVENHGQILPVQGTIAGLSSVANGIAARGDSVENHGQILPVQATLAGLSQVGNGIAARGDSVENHGQIVPIQGTIAGLSSVANGIAARGDSVENHGQIVPVQGTAALLSAVENGIAARSPKAPSVENHGQVLPVQATAALLSEVSNEISARAPLLDALKVPIANQDLLGETVKRYAAEYDEEMAKRALSPNGRGQRPRPRHNKGAGMCSVGKAQCCNQTIKDEDKKKTLAGLLGLNSLAEGDVGLNCQQIPVLGVSLQNTCKSSPVCCQNVSQDGLVNFGCISLPIN